MNDTRQLNQNHAHLTARCSPGASRRDFIRRAGRYILAVLLAMLGIRLAVKARDPHVCVNRGICRGCGAFTACILPQAVSARQAGADFSRSDAHGR